MCKKLVSLYFTGTLTVFMASILLRFLCQNVLIERFGLEKNPFVKAVMFDLPTHLGTFINSDWAGKYPFQQNTARDTAAGSSLAQEQSSFVHFGRARQKIRMFSGRIEGIKTKITNYTTEYLINYSSFAEYAIYIERVLMWNISDGGIVDLGGGYITGFNKKLNESIPEYCNNIFTFNEYLNSEYIDFLYIQAPQKIAESEAELVKDFSNQNASALLAGLAERGVPALDLRQIIRENGLDHHELFYKTDHHWKAETGLWAAGIIADFLNNEHGFGLAAELLQPDMWRRDILEKSFLGSVGRKATLDRAAPEDISIFYPNFETMYDFCIPTRKVDAEGSFSIFYDTAMLQKQTKKSDFYSIIPYSAYLYGDNPVTAIHNKISGSRKRLLVIKDSFANVCVPFLSVVFEWVDVLDLRHFTGSVKTFIQQTAPDMVIVMYIPTASNGHEMFDFR
jgi:hypothetical protein